MTADGKAYAWGYIVYDDVPLLRIESVTSAEPWAATDENDGFYLTLTDTLPNAFVFTPSFAADRSALVDSAPVVISGVSAATTPVAIVGGQYSVGCTGTFTVANGSISMQHVKISRPALLNNSYCKQVLRSAAKSMFSSPVA